MATKAQVQRIANYYKEQFYHYENAVLTGRRSASKAELAKVMRQKHDLENGVEGFHFDLLKGLRPLVWIALNLVYPLGAKRGKAMKLSDWQAWDTAVLFGWVSNETGNRRFADAFIEVARKNGKSVVSVKQIGHTN